MKNQYFGDNRDLFKYDLVYQIIQSGLVDHFTFIPMLTEPDNTKQGGNRNRDKAKAGTENKDLVRFLNAFEDKNKRDIKQLETFFKAKDAITIYRSDKYFSHLRRDEYFKKICDKLLSKSLVFVDPDNGLEIGRTKEKHILYTEVKDLYNKSSILMIFQFLPRKNREIYFSDIREKVKRAVESIPLHISDNQIAFFFLAKDENVRKLLVTVIQDYKKTYPKLA